MICTTLILPSWGLVRPFVLAFDEACLVLVDAFLEDCCFTEDDEELREDIEPPLAIFSVIGMLLQNSNNVEL